MGSKWNIDVVFVNILRMWFLIRAGFQAKDGTVVQMRYWKRTAITRIKRNHLNAMDG